MILFYGDEEHKVYAVSVKEKQDLRALGKLSWLFGWAKLIDQMTVQGYYIGPRKEMVTPWSTNAVEITQNMGIKGVERIEEFIVVDTMNAEYDPMLQAFYQNLNQQIFNIDKEPEPIIEIDNISEYNNQEGLALSNDEVEYLESTAKKIGRKLTDSEVFGFSQVNSEHCRHKIFNGTFIIDGEEKPQSLFDLIKKTSKENPNKLVSAYKDNCAFVKGPVVEQFAPESPEISEYFSIKNIETVVSLKAETHNFPTTVEPFNGAATGTGGEIRDRLAGGKAGLPLIGTAVYMTSYPRSEANRPWEKNIEPRKWLYQTPEEILIKASNGASDFGNKFGQPLICGSLLTFEHVENLKIQGFDKVIMLAGGVGYAKLKDSMKNTPEPGDKIIILGGDNYRIGMGGGAVSSVATGEYDNKIELNAVQRSNPEMQKRVANAIRALSELERNPIVSIHDHGAGGHLNCLSELVEETGGKIDITKLPIGDPTLSAKELIGNESQERMGLVVKEKDIEIIRKIAKRERAPMYVVGEITDDQRLCFYNPDTNQRPIDLDLKDFFGNPPKTILNDSTIKIAYSDLDYNIDNFDEYLNNVLQIEAVACKDWLTNKVDRSVTGRVATQQTAGRIQLPLNNLGVVALDYQGKSGIATAIGHNPVSGLIDPAKSAILSIAESLTNIVWAEIEDGIKGISLSANWMWPAKNNGEDTRLYAAVESASSFACALGINIPTGKDSLSMTQKYPEGDVVYSPGTVIISAAGNVTDIRKTVSPVVENVPESEIIYIDFSKDDFKQGGSSFAQTLNEIGTDCPTVNNPEYFISAFNTIQKLVAERLIIAGHDISAGGMVTTLAEMTFGEKQTGLDVDLACFEGIDPVKVLFSENPGVVIQVENNSEAIKILDENSIDFKRIAKVNSDNRLRILKEDFNVDLDIDQLRDTWFKSSYLLDRKQSGEKLAKQRFDNYKNQVLDFTFNANFTGRLSQFNIEASKTKKSGVKAAIIREKGVNGDREMAWSLHLAGFDVKDVHMTDLISGRETLKDVNMIVFVGGFSNSDVLGSAKGWAGAFLFNKRAKNTLDKFYEREDTLSLGVCNGCQLMIELGLVCGEHEKPVAMAVNDSEKFESAFVTVDIQNSDSIMLQSLKGSRLGVWVAHREGKFQLPYREKKYQIAAKYTHEEYPGNPNGSDFSTAALCSDDGRHLAMMPHLERAIYPWQWAKYPEVRKTDEVSPWVEAFINAKGWIIKNRK